MINFKISEVDWEKYEYPGFEQGDTIADKVTGRHFRCREVATARDLHLEEEDIPEYYKFIAIDNPLGNLGTIWVNPELFELIQKKGKSSSYDELVKKHPWLLNDEPIQNAPIPHPDDLFNGDPGERDPNEDEEEAAELANAVDNQARGVRFVAPAPNNFAWRDGHVVDLNAEPQAQHRPPRRNWPLFGEPGEHLRNEEGVFIRNEHGIARFQPNAPVNPAAEMNQAQANIQAGEGLLRNLNPFRNDVDEVGQPVVPRPWIGQVRTNLDGIRQVFDVNGEWHTLEEPRQPNNVVREGLINPDVMDREVNPNGEVFINAIGDRFERAADGRFIQIPREPLDMGQVRQNLADIRIRQQEQANQLRRAAQAANPNRRR